VINKDFKEGREQVAVKEIHVKEIKDLVLKNHRLTIRDFADAVAFHLDQPKPF